MVTKTKLARALLVAMAIPVAAALDKFLEALLEFEVDLPEDIWVRLEWAAEHLSNMEQILLDSPTDTE